MKIDLDSWLSAARTAVATAGGVAVGLGISQIGAVPISDITSAFGHIFTGIKEICIGGGTLVSVGIGLWGMYKNSPWSRIAAVAAMPEVKVAVSPTAPTNSPAAIAAADPSQPNVIKGVIVPDRTPAAVKTS